MITDQQIDFDSLQPRFALAISVAFKGDNLTLSARGPTLDVRYKRLNAVLEELKETRLHKSRSSRSELEFDLSNFV